MRARMREVGAGVGAPIATPEKRVAVRRSASRAAERLDSLRQFI